LGISFAEYVRRLVTRDLVDHARERAFDLDLGASDKPTDIARDKDMMIGEAVWENARAGWVCL